MADTGPREPRPIEFLARVLLAFRSHVGVPQHPLRPNAMAAEDVLAERGDGPHLLWREVRIAEVVAGVLDFDADRQRIDIPFAGPKRCACMPGPEALGDHLRDPAVVVDHVVARN